LFEQRVWGGRPGAPRSLSVYDAGLMGTAEGEGEDQLDTEPQRRRAGRGARRGPHRQNTACKIRFFGDGRGHGATRHVRSFSSHSRTRSGDTGRESIANTQKRGMAVIWSIPCLFCFFFVFFFLFFCFVFFLFLFFFFFFLPCWDSFTSNGRGWQLGQRLAEGRGPDKTRTLRRRGPRVKICGGSSFTGRAKNDPNIMSLWHT